MRRSIWLAALALGAQAAWAQETTDTMTPGSDIVIGETTESGEPVGEPAGTEVADGETGDTGTGVVDGTGDSGAEVVDDGVGDDGTEVVDDRSGDTGTDVVDDATDDTEVVEEETGDSGTGELVEVPTDNRSPTGAFRGGHHGSVSTLARAGLGPVFGGLRCQGYGDIEIEQVGDQIFVSAARRGEVRNLVYDATTGALVSDVSQAASQGMLESIASGFKQARDPAGSRGKGASGHGRGGAKEKERGGSGGKSGDRAGKEGGRGGGGSKGGGHGGGGHGGGGSKGGGQGGGHGGGGSKGGGQGGGHGGGRNK